MTRCYATINFGILVLIGERRVFSRVKIEKSNYIGD